MEETSGRATKEEASLFQDKQTIDVVCTPGMFRLSIKSAMWMQVSILTKQEHTRLISFNQLISVFRQLIGSCVSLESLYGIQNRLRKHSYRKTAK